ncbi:hypothetical protein [Falsibacillus pallidus]|uniref:Uncharacterized protein n=1 Tax=Falsibacillus pallidus TaxID=493781 RepID=A0A370GWC4_9BACI|nr:hypothetical protein [Falsibacillus pallidus]RDI47957.1 hypothetical protein DFR59_101624 [Falsibacillus pallidus]
MIGILILLFLCLIILFGSYLALSAKGFSYMDDSKDPFKDLFKK